MTTIKAVSDRRVITMDVSHFRAGPKMIEGLTLLAEKLHSQERHPEALR